MLTITHASPDLESQAGSQAARLANDYKDVLGKISLFRNTPKLHASLSEALADRQLHQRCQRMTPEELDLNIGKARTRRACRIITRQTIGTSCTFVASRLIGTLLRAKTPLAIGTTGILESTAMGFLTVLAERANGAGMLNGERWIQPAVITHAADADHPIERYANPFNFVHKLPGGCPGMINPYRAGMVIHDFSWALPFSVLYGLIDAMDDYHIVDFEPWQKDLAKAAACLVSGVFAGAAQFMYQSVYQENHVWLTTGDESINKGIEDLNQPNFTACKGYLRNTANAYWTAFKRIGDFNVQNMTEIALSGGSRTLLVMGLGALTQKDYRVADSSIMSWGFFARLTGIGAGMVSKLAGQCMHSKNQASAVSASTVRIRPALPAEAYFNGAGV